MDEEQLIQAVVEALQVGDGKQLGWTTRELCDSLGWGVERIRRALRTLNEAGRLEITKKGQIRLDGAITWVPAYYLKDAEKDETG